MTDPYDVLEISPDADAETIRQRYLEMVHQYPPEREPQRFAEIRAAYDALRDPLAALESRLFSVSAAHTFDQILAHNLPDVRSRRLPTDFLLSLGQP